jgi:urease accessory protein
MNAAAVGLGSGWSARLELEVQRDGERSRLSHLEHRGPLRVQRPFYPEGPTPIHVYLLHPPGGMVGGDELETSVRVLPRAELLATTPAAQKLYRSLGALSSQRVRLTVGEGASLEWFPSETIVFDGAFARQTSSVELAEGAAFIGWDIGCFGRPASGLDFTRGELRQSFELRRSGTLLVVERTRVPGGSAALSEAWGYGKAPVYATLYAVPRAAEAAAPLAPLVRDALGDMPLLKSAVTVIDGVLALRVLGSGVEPVRAALVRAWSALRPEVLGRVAAPPRIWAT